MTCLEAATALQRQCVKCIQARVMVSLVCGVIVSVNNRSSSRQTKAERRHKVTDGGCLSSSVHLVIVVL